MELTLAEIAAKLGARLVGDGRVSIRGVAGIREAGPGEITFLANPRYEEFLARTRASAVILHSSATPPGIPVLYTEQPYLAFLGVLQIFDSGRGERPPAGVHPTAVIAASARLGQDVCVGPWVVVGDDCEVGPRTVLMAGAYLGPGARLGADCLVYPHVVIRKECEIGERVVIHAGAVIGDDGFGFAPDGDSYRKIPQIGRVVIEDDVEIGANTTIDRATVGVTRVGRGSRIDNLVMIAHGVEIGRNTIICAQVGISGSSRIGEHVTLGGQAGLAGHISVGDNARIGAQAGVTKSVPAGESVSGYPAQPHIRAQRMYASLHALPEDHRRLRQMNRRLEEMEQRLNDLETK
jgi:UDP-3-O-[3-hydroxymyristoyl] glucosamine N-acyltransferase